MVACACTLLFAAFGFCRGLLTDEQAVQLASTALIGLGLRDAMANGK